MFLPKMAGGLSDLFGGGQDPGGAASPYMNQVPGIYQKYLDPYTQAGTQAMGTVQEQLQKLLSDPSALMSKIGGSYSESPGFQHNVSAATQAAKNAAAAGGQSGSPAVQQALAQQVSGMASQDYGDYMKNALGMYGTGLSGEQDIMHQGEHAAGSLADALAQAQMQQAQMAYGGAMGANQQAGNIFGGLTGLAGQLGGAAMMGGFF